MSSNNNQINVPQAKEAMERFKMECVNEVGVNLKQGYNGDISAREAGSVGGQMVKKMIESYENSMKSVSYTHLEANAIIHASREQMIGATLYLVGKEMSNGEYVQNTSSCAMCKRCLLYTSRS